MQKHDMDRGLDHQRLKLWIKSALIGCAIGTVELWPWPPLGNLIAVPISVLMFPGFAVSMVLNGGPVHDASEVVMTSANVAFYTILSYLFLRARKNRRDARAVSKTNPRPIRGPNI